jgi:3-dehydroquinate synthase
MELRDPGGRLRILEGLEEFRQHLGGELSVTLLREIGRGEDVHRVERDEVARAMAWLRRRETGL